MTRTYKYCRECELYGEHCSNITEETITIDRDTMDLALRYKDNKVRNTIISVMTGHIIDWDNVVMMVPVYRKRQYVPVTWNGNSFNFNHPRSEVALNDVIIVQRYREHNYKQYSICWYGIDRCCSGMTNTWFSDRSFWSDYRRRMGRGANKQKGMKKSFYNYMKHELKSIQN